MKINSGRKHKDMYKAERHQSESPREEITFFQATPEWQVHTWITYWTQARNKLCGYNHLAFLWGILLNSRFFFILEERTELWYHTHYSSNQRRVIRISTNGRMCRSKRHRRHPQPPPSQQQKGTYGTTPGSQKKLGRPNYHWRGPRLPPPQQPKG